LHFDERTEGHYRIFAGAREALQGDGYVAAIVVQHVHSESRTGREVYRDESLACGHRRESPDDALHYAMNRAQEIITTQTRNLAR
jgi:hypothetical protein